MKKKNKIEKIDKSEGQYSCDVVSVLIETVNELVEEVNRLAKAVKAHNDEFGEVAMDYEGLRREIDKPRPSTQFGH